MKIYIDGTRVKYNGPVSMPWGNFLETLLDKYVNEPRVVATIFMDNIEAKHLLSTGSQMPVPGNVQKVEIITRDLYSLAFDGFSKMFSLIRHLKDEAVRSAGLFRNGDANNAAEILKDIMAAVRPVIDFVNSIGINFALDFDNIVFEENVTLRHRLEFSLQSLTKYNHIYNKKDMMELTDFLIGYLAEDVSEWDKIFTILSSEVKAHTSLKKN